MTYFSNTPVAIKWAWIIADTSAIWNLPLLTINFCRYTITPKAYFNERIGPVGKLWYCWSAEAHVIASILWQEANPSHHWHSYNEQRETSMGKKNHNWTVTLCLHKYITEGLIVLVLYVVGSSNKCQVNGGVTKLCNNSDARYNRLAEESLMTFEMTWIVTKTFLVK